MVNTSLCKLAESVTAMEERKAKLQEQLAKLNGEILTSEVVPRSMSGLPMSPKMKRRRISDISSVGMGTPKKGMGDRRAVSNMLRVTEEAEMPAIAKLIEVTESASVSTRTRHAPALAKVQTFGDDIVTSLRRRLTAKEDELRLVNQQLSEALAQMARLTAAKEAEVQALRGELDRLITERQTMIEERIATDTDFESRLRDAQIQLESTRSELVKTINEKSASIDKLEETILDLRKSREDLAIEDQDRYDELKRELDQRTAEAQLANEENNIAQKRLSDMEAAHAKAVAAIDREKLDAVDLAEQLKRELGDLGKQRDESAQRAEQMTGRSQALEAEMAGLKLRLDTGTAEHAKLVSDHARLTEERDAMERSRQEARDDLDHFQKAAMSSESNAIAALKAEIANMRKAREEEEDASKRQATELQATLDAEKARTEELARRVERMQTSTGELEAALATARAEQNDVSTRECDLVRQLERERINAKAQLDEERSSVASLLKEIEAQKHIIAEAASQETAFVSARASADLREEELTKEVERLKDDVRSAVERERVHVETTEARIADLSTQLREAERREGSLRAAFSDGDSQAQTLRDEVASLKAALDRAMEEARRHAESARNEIDSQMARAVQAEDATTRLLEQHESISSREQTIRQQVVALQAASEKAIAIERSRADTAVEELEAERTRSAELERREAAVLEAKGLVETRERDLAQQLERLRKSVAESQTKLSGTLETLQAEITARQAAEAAGDDAKTDLAKRSAALSQLDIDNTAMRQALTNAQNELKAAEKKARASSENATFLAKELAELKMSLPTSGSTASIRSRHTVSASAPTIPSNAVIHSLRAQALTSASTGHDSNSPAAKLMTAEKEEIDRLEKIVEAQKVIIDDQKEKIKFWARVSIVQSWMIEN